MKVVGDVKVGLTIGHVDIDPWAGQPRGEFLVRPIQAFIPNRRCSPSSLTISRRYPGANIPAVTSTKRPGWGRSLAVHSPECDGRLRRARAPL
jgi:hypothetical protein